MSASHTRTRDAPELLGAADLREISRNAVMRRYPAKAMVVTEGDQTDSLFIIQEGRVKAFISDEAGREVVLSEMRPGEYFGEVALDRGPRSASVMTLEPSVMSVIPGADFDRFVQENPRFATFFIRHLLRRIRVLTRNVGTLALMDAYGRVARFLLENAISEGGADYVPHRPTQADIAARVGCSREMVSRAFKGLVQEGYISLKADRILIQRKSPAKQ
jgi:CRP/FNR family transcriptional regulator, cyclic AMP receptor protein